MAEMLRYAALSFAAVLDRAVAEARVHAPETGLAAATLIAALRAPARLAANRSANARERRAVEAIYDELQATGTVEGHLPEEERRVRERYAAEVLALRTPGPQASQVFPFRPRERVVTRVDRERAAALGVDMTDVATALQLMVGGDDEVSRFRDPLVNDDYDVQLRLSEGTRNDPEAILGLYLPTADGNMVQLGNFVSVKEETTASRVDRLDRQRQVSLRASVAPGYALADRLEALQRFRDKALRAWERAATAEEQKQIDALATLRHVAALRESAQRSRP